MAEQYFPWTIAVKSENKVSTNEGTRGIKPEE